MDLLKCTTAQEAAVCSSKPVEKLLFMIKDKLDSVSKETTAGLKYQKTRIIVDIIEIALINSYTLNSETGFSYLLFKERLRFSNRRTSVEADVCQE